MKTIVALLSLLLVIAQVKVVPATVCDLKTSEFSKEHPLVLRPIEGSKGHYEIDDPDRDDSLIFESGQKVLFACPGSKFKNSVKTLLNAECVREKQFVKEGGSNMNQSFENIKCNGIPKSVMKENGNCAKNKSAFEIGFKTDKIFVKVMDICFDRDTNSAVYVKHKVSHNINGSQKNFVRPQFKEDKLFKNVQTADVYKKEYQERLFDEYVEAPATVAKYVNGKQYLARGHLAPKADYVYGAQQTATFYYANTAPQWQSFNSGNWSKLEASVRKLAVTRRKGLTVYTGTYGQYEVAGKPVYLARDDSGKRTMPVPLVFWKVVLDEDAKTAVAFVGLNDPRGDPRDNAARDACGGTDVCGQVLWAPKFNPAPKSGLMYCCTVDKLRRAVSVLPSVGKVGLLRRRVPLGESASV